VNSFPYFHILLGKTRTSHQVCQRSTDCLGREKCFRRL